MANKIVPPTAADYELAKQVAEWMESLSEVEQANDYLSNLGTFGRCGIVNTKGMGIVASAPQAFNRELARKIEKANTVSKHVGTVGERIVLQVKLLSVFDSQGDFGATYIHKFELVGGEDAGALLTWFGSSRLRTPTEERYVEVGSDYVKPGNVVWIKATVKRHSEFKGTKETHVSRADLVDDPETAKSKKADAAKAKREAAKASKAARKAFGEAKVVAVWRGQVGGYSTGSYAMEDVGEKTRVVQLSENEFVAQYLDADKGWETHGKPSNLDEAESVASRGCYCGWTGNLVRVHQE